MSACNKKKQHTTYKEEKLLASAHLLRGKNSNIMANTLNIFNIDKHYLTATIPFLLDIQGFGIHNKPITTYYISWTIQHTNLYRRIKFVKIYFSAAMNLVYSRAVPITNIETKSLLLSFSLTLALTWLHRRRE